MLGEMHDILHEFPNLEGKITDLHENNLEFATLMDQHDVVDGKIRNFEEQGSPTTDEHMEELKYRRTELKDQVYALLRAL